MATLLTYITEIIVVIALIICLLKTNSSLNKKDITKAYIYGGITAVLGLVEGVLVVINCF